MKQHVFSLHEGIKALTEVKIALDSLSVIGFINYSWSNYCLLYIAII